MDNETPKRKRGTALPQTLEQAPRATGPGGVPVPTFARRTTKQNYVISPGVYEELSSVLEERARRALQFGADGDLHAKRRAKRQDLKADRIHESLKPFDPLETSRCLHNIEKAYKGYHRPDYEGMFETAGERGCSSVVSLIEGFTVKDEDAWSKFAVNVMENLHGGSNYTASLSAAMTNSSFEQGPSNVATYIEKHAVTLSAILRVYERDPNISRRETVQLETVFVKKWIDGLQSSLKTTLPVLYATSLSAGQHMEFKHVCETALIEERVNVDSGKTGKEHKGENGAAHAAAAGVVSSAQLQRDGQNNSRVESEIRSGLASFDKQLEASVAAMQAAAAAFTSASKMTSSQICYHCQRRGLPHDHHHLTCPVKAAVLARKFATDNANVNAPPFGNREVNASPFQPRFSQPQAPFVPGPPPGNPGISCFRCGRLGHRATGCELPCKVCKKEGRSAHHPGCSNTPPPRMGNGVRPPAHRR